MKIYVIRDTDVDIQILSLEDIKFAIDFKDGFDNSVYYVIKSITEIMDYFD